MDKINSLSMDKINSLSKIKKSKAGFTLIEVIIVVVIIGILSAIAIPNFLSWLPEMRLKAASRDVYSKMQEARMLAIKGNRNYAIFFDIPNNQYFVRDDSGPDHLPSTGDVGENDGTYSANETLDTTVLTTYGSGLTYGSGPATVDVSNNPGPAGFVSYAAPVATAVFDPRGFGNAGYVYLTNQNNDDSFAIGSLSSGSIRLLRWTGAVVGDKWL